MSGSRRRANALVESSGGLIEVARSPEHGHFRIIVEVDGEDPYPEGTFPPAGMNCRGCNRLWSELEQSQFLPPCQKPGETLKIVIEYTEDPNALKLEPREDGNDAPIEYKAVEPSQTPSEPIMQVDSEPAAEELIPDEATLNAMSGAEIDALYDRVVAQKNLKGRR